MTPAMTTGIKKPARLLAVCACIAAALAASSAFVHAVETTSLPAIFDSLEASQNGRAEVKALEDFVQANRRSSGVDEAMLRLGRIYFSRKEYAKSIDVLQRLLEDHISTRFKIEAMYELGAARKRSGLIRDARDILLVVVDSDEATLTLKSKARLLLKETDAGPSHEAEKGPPAIGVMLPLKGSYKKHGEDALRGVMLAAGAFGGAAKVEIIVRDVGADAASAKKALEEFSENPRVAALLGPLLNASAVEAAKGAQASGLPVIALAQKEGITEAGEYVFRSFLTPAAQAAAIAEYAVKTLGVKNVAVLHPSSSYGTEMAKLFAKEMLRHGASISAEQSYQSGATDFNVQVRQIFNVQVKERKEGRRSIKEYEPRSKATALFIPDTYETVSLIAPYLDYYNIRDVRLLGTSAWNSPSLVELGGKNVEGAVFVDAFHLKSASPEAQAFVKNFNDTFGADPSALEAQAYDAAAILIDAVAESAKPTDDPALARRAATAKMAAVKGFKGATGDISFSEGRDAQRKLFIITVKNGELVEASSQPPISPTQRPAPKK